MLFNKLITIALLIFTVAIIHEGSIVLGSVAKISLSTSQAGVK